MSINSLTQDQLDRIAANKERALLLLREKKRKDEVSIKESLIIEHNDNIDTPNDFSKDTNSIARKPCEQLTTDGVVCGRCPVLAPLADIFNIHVCMPCKLQTDDYDFITKAEIASAYLITDAGILEDLPFTTKENPRNSAWTPMKLYLRKHIQEISHKKFGGEEGLEREIKKRNEKKFKRKLESTQSSFDQQYEFYENEVYQSEHNTDKSRSLLWDLSNQTNNGTEGIPNAVSSDIDSGNLSRNNPINYSNNDNSDNIIAAEEIGNIASSMAFRSHKKAALLSREQISNSAAVSIGCSKRQQSIIKSKKKTKAIAGLLSSICGNDA